MKSVNLRLSQRGQITLPQTLREAYGLQPGDTLTLIDLGGVFILSPRRSEIDTMADKIADQWKADGETLASMLDAQHEAHDRRNS